MSLQQALEIAEGKRDLPGPLPRLAYALGKDRYPLLELLLARGENPNACIAGGSAMGLLARTGDMEGMRLLREAGAEVDAPRDVLGGTPLLAALSAGSWLSALLLLEWGADARATTDYGFTALHELAIAVTPAGDDQKQLQIEVAIRLADAGSPLDPRNLLGSTPLMYATAARNDSLAAWLVERGADPQAANDRGDTPLALARRRGQSALVELFEQASSRRHGAE
jgi:ankyrin repeat protein